MSRNTALDDVGTSAPDQTGWFIRLGLTRALAAIGFVVVALFLGDWLDTGNPIASIFGTTALLLGALTVAGRLSSWANESRLPWLLGPGRSAALVFCGCVAVGILASVTLPVVSAFQDSNWIIDHGGAGGLFMTVTLVLLAILFTSAVLRVLVRVIVLFVRLCLRRHRVTAPPVGNRWNSFEAATLLAVCGFCAAGVVMGWSGSPSVTLLTSTGDRVVPGEVTRSFTWASDQDLLTGFAPVLNIMLDEGRPPQRVDDYLAESTVLGLDGEVVMHGPHPDELDEVDCSGRARPCLVLDNPSCPDSSACEPWELAETLPSGVGVDENVVGYGRVLRRSSDDIVWDASPFGEELTMIAQWWLFAPYDGWEAPVGWTGAEMIKQHEGDWEAVVMGFSDEAPLFVGGTSHCGGTWRAFDEVRVDNFGYPPADLFGSLLHPSLGHAKGSHAIYFDSYQGRSPDSLGCTKESRSNLFRIGAYALNMRDETSTALPVLLSPISGPEATAVLEFPAYWGIENDVHLSTPFHTWGGPTGSVAHPDGPSSPSTKPLYVEPVTTVFCSSTWHYDGERSVGETRCP